MRIILSIIACLFFFTGVFAQQKYWVEVDTEKCSGGCFERVQQELMASGYQLRQVSSWLNAISVSLTEKELTTLSNHDYVKGITKVNVFRLQGISQSSDTSFTSVLKQINASAFTKRKITGKGIKVGVIDAGFVNVDSGSYFNHLQQGGQIKAIHDFINPNRKDMYTKLTSGDTHGREVMKRVTGFNPKTKVQLGLASGAEFYLARTENGDKEHRVEEDNWVAALEWMHENGVRLVNTSLGYADDFDDPEERYITRQMNGKHAMITKAAEMAVKQKGMIIVVSAGNKGGKDWRIVTAPADARNVISVGATKKKVKSRIGYSSIGSEKVNYIKPDVSCYSRNGTSFSAPVITGVVACMLQINPTLTSTEIKQYLFKASHLRKVPNNYLGYGVPDLDKVYQLMNGKVVPSNLTVIKGAGKSMVRIELGKATDDVVIFHKKDKWRVVKEEVIKVKKSGKKKASIYVERSKGGNYLKVYRMSSYYYSTVQVGDTVYEIEW